MEELIERRFYYKHELVGKIQTDCRNVPFTQKRFAKDETTLIISREETSFSDFDTTHKQKHDTN